MSPPLEFINIQHPKRESTSRIHQGTISMDLAVYRWLSCNLLRIFSCSGNSVNVHDSEDSSHQLSTLLKCFTMYLHQLDLWHPKMHQTAKAEWLSWEFSTLKQFVLDANWQIQNKVRTLITFYSFTDLWTNSNTRWVCTINPPFFRLEKSGCRLKGCKSILDFEHTEKP